ncbi:radical SAM protein [Paenibacillus sp. ACRRX]|uniref:radical SAM/SPASM domain-containing protein n=1 Tax=unclassified Paenibacillus TaxID=185978 RepID=UPI001EF59A66|nr:MULTISPECIES: radical SAM protein [unclassified Paenibacillus]MCG7407267.1 radical SAM protein [Paenibacillus sp. ACRRX]MDK8180486.1 radical SAM protein [Paenibacillus sp. UMB4589-SE434]
MLTEAIGLRDEALNDYVRNLTPEIKQLTLFPSEMCNYRCSFCHIWGETGWALKEPQRVIREQLDINVLKGFIDQVTANNKKLGVIITGGEPMLYKHLNELVEHLRSKKANIYLLTNGSLMKKQIPFIMKNIVAMNISLDGPEEFHDSIRGKGSFNTVCENVEMLIQEKKRNNKMFPFINITMVLSKYNYKSTKNFMQALRDRFKDANIVLHDTKTPWTKRRDMSVNFAPLLFTSQERGLMYAEQMKEHLDCNVSPAWQGFVEEDIGIDTQLLKRDMEEIWRSEGVDSSQYIDIHEYFTDIDNVFGHTKCVAPWHELVVRRTGDVYPCVDFPDYKYGNIYEDTFQDMWEGERAVKFRNYMRNDNLLVCNRCVRMFADKDSF